MNPIWLAPLAVGAASAVVLGQAARRLSREIEAVHQALRPVRTARSSRSDSPPRAR